MDVDEDSEQPALHGEDDSSHDSASSDSNGSGTSSSDGEGDAGETVDTPVTSDSEDDGNGTLGQPGSNGKAPIHVGPDRRGPGTPTVADKWHGRGRGGVGNRGLHQQPPPPSKLHAVLTKGNWMRPPTYQLWANADEVTNDLPSGQSCYSLPTTLNWKSKSVFLGKAISLRFAFPQACEGSYQVFSVILPNTMFA